TSDEKQTAMQLIRRWMREGVLLLPDHAELRSQFTNLKARLQPSGQIKYLTNGRDFASTVITLAMASALGVLPGSRPQRKTLLQALGEMTPQERAAQFNRTAARLGYHGSMDHRDGVVKEFIHGQWVPVRR